MVEMEFETAMHWLELSEYLSPSPALKSNQIHTKQ